MGIIRLLAAIFKAVPVLGRLFSRFADEKKEQKAQERYEEKLDFIDSVVDGHSNLRLRDGNEDEQREGTNGAPAVPKCSPRRTRVGKGSTKDGGKTRVRARKKMKKDTKSYAPVKKKKGGKKKKQSVQAAES